MSTVSPPITIFAEISPSTLSIAVPPSSVYAAPWFTSVGDVPFKVIIGGVVSGPAPSIIMV